MYTRLTQLRPLPPPQDKMVRPLVIEDRSRWQTAQKVSVSFNHNWKSPQINWYDEVTRHFINWGKRSSINSFPLGSCHLISLTLILARNYEPVMKLKKKKLLKCIRTPKEINITVRGSIYNMATTDQVSVELLSIDWVIKDGWTTPAFHRICSCGVKRNQTLQNSNLSFPHLPQI